MADEWTAGDNAQMKVAGEALKKGDRVTIARPPVAGVVAVTDGRGNEYVVYVAMLERPQ